MKVITAQGLGLDYEERPKQPPPTGFPPHPVIFFFQGLLFQKQKKNDTFSEFEQNSFLAFGNMRNVMMVLTCFFAFERGWQKKRRKFYFWHIQQQLRIYHP